MDGVHRSDSRDALVRKDSMTRINSRARSRLRRKSADEEDEEDAAQASRAAAAGSRRSTDNVTGLLQRRPSLILQLEDAAGVYRHSGSWLWMQFRDPDMETSFAERYDSRSTFTFRLYSFLFLVFHAVTFALLDLHDYGESVNRRTLYFARGPAVIVSLLSLLVTVTPQWASRTVPYQPTMSAALVAQAACMLLLTYTTQESGSRRADEVLVPNAALVVLILGYSAYRLTVLWALVSGLSIQLLFNALFVPLVATGWLDLPWYALSYNVPFAAFNAVGTLTAYQLERNERENFVSNRARLREAAKSAYEAERAQYLLLNVLPARIVYRLRTQPTIAARVPNVTVLFICIENLVEMTMEELKRSTVGSIKLMNTLFGVVDQRCAEFGVEKVKTLQDRYMCVSGAPEERPDHAEAMADMALSVFEDFAQIQEPRHRFTYRAGMASGPVVAGVIGLKSFCWDIYGDTVNTASRMEYPKGGSKISGKIRVDGNAASLLQATHVLEEQPDLQVKGKGPLRNFVLVGRRTDVAGPGAATTAAAAAAWQREPEVQGEGKKQQRSSSSSTDMMAPAESWDAAYFAGDRVRSAPGEPAAADGSDASARVAAGAGGDGGISSGDGDGGVDHGGDRHDAPAPAAAAAATGAGRASFNLNGSLLSAIMAAAAVARNANLGPNSNDGTQQRGRAGTTAAAPPTGSESDSESEAASEASEASGGDGDGNHDNEAKAADDDGGGGGAGGKTDDGVELRALQQRTEDRPPSASASPRASSAPQGPARLQSDRSLHRLLRANTKRVLSLRRSSAAWTVTTVAVPVLNVHQYVADAQQADFPRPAWWSMSGEERAQFRRSRFETRLTTSPTMPRALLAATLVYGLFFAMTPLLSPAVPSLVYLVRYAGVVPAMLLHRLLMGWRAFYTVNVSGLLAVLTVLAVVAAEAFTQIEVEENPRAGAAFYSPVPVVYACYLGFAVFGLGTRWVLLMVTSVLALLGGGWALGWPLTEERTYFASYALGLLVFGVYVAWELEDRALLNFHFVTAAERERRAIEDRRAEADSLLTNVVPAEVVSRLNLLDTSTVAEAHDRVCILFSDVAGFTAMSSQMEPKELVNWLNRFFSLFDVLADRYHVHKIKTIGDAWVGCAGLFDADGRRHHVNDTVNMAVSLQESLAQRNAEAERLGRLPVRLRIGVHTGPVVAGVIGRRKFQYDIIGESVRYAEEMESSGRVGRVHISDAARKALIRADFLFRFEEGEPHEDGRPTWFVDWAQQAAEDAASPSASPRRDKVRQKFGSIIDTTTGAVREAESDLRPSSIRRLASSSSSVSAHAAAAATIEEEAS